MHVPPRTWLMFREIKDGGQEGEAPQERKDVLGGAPSPPTYNQEKDCKGEMQ